MTVVGELSPYNSLDDICKIYIRVIILPVRTFYDKIIIYNIIPKLIDYRDPTKQYQNSPTTSSSCIREDKSY